MHSARTLVRTMGDPEPLRLEVAPKLARHYVLSPYVFALPGGYGMFVRLVNKSDDASKKVSRIHTAESTDGLAFTIEEQPAIDAGRAGTDDDRGCEDPTVVMDRERFYVFYSGYGGFQKASSMLFATGDARRGVFKRGRAFDGIDNPKEACVVATVTGFRMFFEYALEGASRIGVADARSLEGPWTSQPTPITERANAFDSWHLSPASAVRLADGTHVLFYNGSNKETQWRVGWAHLSADARIVERRCEQPLVDTFGLEPGDTDIAFAASAVVESKGVVSLYYSISDRRLLRQRVAVEDAVTESASPRS